MDVVECRMPETSVLGLPLVEGAYFHDSYRAPLKRVDSGIVDIFFAVFGHTPLWMKLVLVSRNALVRLVGLKVPTVAEIMKTEIRTAYGVGDKIGPWPIFHIDGNEIVAGRDNRHMDFRLSVLRTADDGALSVVVSTVCTVHNLLGKIYLFFIVPFHRYGVRSLMSNAVAAGRL